MTTIVEYFGLQADGHCGYCRSDGPDKFNHGMWAHTMTVRDYQALIDRGWRRSGKYCYKPVMNRTCCPQYTIRCRALEFCLSRSQKRVLKAMNRFLATGERRRSRSVSSNSSAAKSESITASEIIDHVRKRAANISKENQPRLAAPLNPEIAMNVSWDGNSNSKHPKKAKLLRMQRKREKLLAKGTDPKSYYENKRAKRMPKKKTIEDFFNDANSVANPSHRLELRLVLVEPPSGEFKQTMQNSHAVYYRYQMQIHHDAPSKPNEQQFQRFLCDSPLEVISVIVNEDDEGFKRTLDASCALYQRYQVQVHGDLLEDCDREAFEGFLASTPHLLIKHPSTEHPGYGSFHQQYLLDGKLIAVGVVDILPGCVSSKYLFYDPDYEFLSLGTYSALREIALVRKIAQVDSNLKYYYMGFYVHSCPKMRYKAKFLPGDLLCPETFLWQPIEKSLPKLELSKYSRLEEDSTKRDENGDVDLNEVKILHRRDIQLYSTYRSKMTENNQPFNEAEVQEYAMLVGKECARRILLYRH